MEKEGEVRKRMAHPADATSEVRCGGERWQEGEARERPEAFFPRNAPRVSPRIPLPTMHLLCSHAGGD